MSKYVSRGLALVLFTGGLTLLGAGIANAADTTGDDGLLSGTQIVAPVTAPVEVAGNAISVLGDALSGGAAAPAPAPAPVAPVVPAAPAPAAPTTSGTDSVLGGTQAVVEAAAPVAVQGNAISVVGDTEAAPAPAAAAPAAPVAEPAAPAAAPTTSGSDGILGGTQVLPTISVPVNLGGNSISVLGDASSSSSDAAAPAAAEPATTNGASTTGSDSVAGGTQVVPNVTAPVTVGGNAISVLGDSSSSSEGAAAPAAATPAGSGGATTSGSDGIAGGTQVVPNVTAPVNVGGNAISVLGDSSSSSEGAAAPAAATPAGSGGATTSGSDGIAGGTQVVPNVTAPVNLGGNAISVLGDSSSEGAAGPAATTPTGTTGGATTTGSDSVAGGSQIAPDVALPVSIGGNAISILGDAASTGSSTSPAQEGTNDDVTTTGNDGILGGTQIVPSIVLPITVGGNAISVIGDAETDGTSGVDGFPGDPTDPTDPVTPTDPTDPTDPVIPTDPTDGTDGTDGTAGIDGIDGTVVVDAGVSTTGTTVAFGTGATATAALSVQALASTGAEIAPLVGVIALLLVAGIVLLIIGRRRAV